MKKLVSLLIWFLWTLLYLDEAAVAEQCTPIMNSSILSGSEKGEIISVKGILKISRGESYCTILEGESRGIKIAAFDMLQQGVGDGIPGKENFTSTIRFNDGDDLNGDVELEPGGMLFVLPRIAEAASSLAKLKTTLVQCPLDQNSLTVVLLDGAARFAPPTTGKWRSCTPRSVASGTGFRYQITPYAVTVTPTVGSVELSHYVDGELQSAKTYPANTQGSIIYHINAQNGIKVEESFTNQSNLTRFQRDTEKIRQDIFRQTTGVDDVQITIGF